VGLNRPGTNYPIPNPPRPNLPAINQPRPSQPSQNPPVQNLPKPEPLREESFSGLDSFFEPERLETKSGAWRVLLLLALLAGLGAAGWWTYTNYFGASGGQKPGPAASSATSSPSQETAAKPAASDAVPPLDAGPSQAAAPSAPVPENLPDQASSSPGPAPAAVSATVKPKAQPSLPAKPAPAKPARSNPKIPRIALGDKSAERYEHKVPSTKASNLLVPAAAAATDAGDAAFRKGEAYLYGRGVKENCDEALKYLKAASAKSNAKARSAFGTMYATGHCVQRDLPTSYSWFARALHADPNNQVLEKDLNQVWIQMTPSERQVALKTKP
jgi:cytoskeletal protein RodZ